jgi:hypothetical protein
VALSGSLLVNGLHLEEVGPYVRRSVERATKEGQAVKGSQTRDRKADGRKLAARS